MNTSLAKLSALLDSVPQLPGGAWVNHFAYGGGLGVLIGVGIHQFAFPWQFCFLIATVLVGGLCAVKKVGDFMPPKNESLFMCVGKTVVTAAIPAIILSLTYLH
jgi:hypothetical protein